MKKIALLLVFFLSACATGGKQVVAVDSNVSAFLYSGENRVGETPFVGELSFKEIGALTLRKSGYKTVKVPVKKTHRRSAEVLLKIPFQLTTQQEYEGMTVAVISSPLSTALDISFLTMMPVVEYMPNVFYVEMIPNNQKQATLEILKKLQVKEFALKMYPALALGDSEAFKALSALSGKSEFEIETMLFSKNDAVSFAEMLVF